MNTAPTVSAVTDSYEYDAYGNEFTVSGSTPNEFMYRGEQFDSDLGLYYLRARYYNPATGRFMSRDPLDGSGFDPKTLHKYLYAGGDPIDGIDPTGRAAYIESILSERVVISSPLEIAVANYGLLVAHGICGIARVIVSVTKWAPTGAIPSPFPFPLASFSVLAALCNSIPL
jgi:RHS repeat-associated protein